MIYNKDGKRLLIYFFYDRQGIVDRYVDYLLNDIMKSVDELIVVCNGLLNDEGKAVFAKYAKDENIIVRDNKGFDVWAYKTALEHVGYENLKNYSEVIMMNFTIMGPIYPFAEMFEEMDKRDLDFWGMTIFHKINANPYDIKYGYIPTHLQSHFIAVRTDMLTSKEYINYWKNMPEIKSYMDAVGKHEAIFTKTFDDYGFNWDVYVDTKDLLKNCHHPIILKPKELIENRKCPIFKRRSFFHNYDDILDYTTGEPALELFDYIKDHTDYDVNMIFENLLRLENQADLKKNLHWNYNLPFEYDTNPEIEIKDKKIALVIHQYFDDLIDYCYDYALSMPVESDIYITTDTARKQKAIEEKFKQGPWNKVEVILIENRGRDVSALLVATKEFIHNYDYVCFMHDKKVAQLDMGIKGEAFSYKCFENLLKSKEFVKNVINTFEKNEKLGIMMPPPPNFAEYYPTIGATDWGPNYDETVKLAKKLKLTVNINKDKEPIAPLGTMFWFRPAAMKLLFDQDWEYDDFPAEPNKIDGTLLHAVERIYPYVVQQEGYYPAWLMNEKYATIELDNLYFMLRQLNKSVFETFGVSTQNAIIKRLEDTKEYILYPELNVCKLYLCTEKGYSEKDSVFYNYPAYTHDFVYKKLSKFGPVSEFRWDPNELPGGQVMIEMVKIKLKSGEVIYKSQKDAIHNGFQINEAIVFVGNDPQLVFKLPKKCIIESVHIKAHIEKNMTENNLRYIEGKLRKKNVVKRVAKKILRR